MNMEAWSSLSTSEILWRLRKYKMMIFLSRMPPAIFYCRIYQVYLSRPSSTHKKTLWHDWYNLSCLVPKEQLFIKEMALTFLCLILFWIIIAIKCSLSLLYELMSLFSSCRGIIAYAMIIGRLPFRQPFKEEFQRKQLLDSIQKGLTSMHDREMSGLTSGQTTTTLAHGFWGKILVAGRSINSKG